MKKTALASAAASQLIVSSSLYAEYPDQALVQQARQLQYPCAVAVLAHDLHLLTHQFRRQQFSIAHGHYPAGHTVLTSSRG